MRGRPRTSRSLSPTSPKSACVIKPEAVQTQFGGFYGGFITQAQLIKSLTVGDCFNRKPFLLSHKWWGWGGTRSSNPITMWLVPLVSSPSLWKGGMLVP